MSKARDTEGRQGPWTVPNFVTLLRLAIIPGFLYCISEGRHEAALVLFVAAGISDGLDGYLARRFDMKSAFGAALDPIADKLMMMSSYVMLSIPAYSGRIHVPPGLTILVISRDFLILLIALLMLLTTNIRSFPPTRIGKTNTVVQILTILAVLCLDLWNLPRIFATVPFIATAAFTVASGLQYVYLVARRIAEHEKREDGR
jgi:cardiolipin synthase